LYAPFAVVRPGQLPGESRFGVQPVVFTFKSKGLCLKIKTIYCFFQLFFGLLMEHGLSGF
jgi:hypothetical protein